MGEPYSDMRELYTDMQRSFYMNLRNGNVLLFLVPPFPARAISSTLDLASGDKEEERDRERQREEDREREGRR